MTEGNTGAWADHLPTRQIMLIEEGAVIAHRKPATQGSFFERVIRYVRPF